MSGDKKSDGAASFWGVSTSYNRAQIHPQLTLTTQVNLMEKPTFRFSAGREAAIKRRLVTLLTKGEVYISYYDAVSNSEKKTPKPKEVQALRILLESVLPQFHLTINNFREASCEFWLKRIRDTRLVVIEGQAYLFTDGELPVPLGEVKEYVPNQM